MGKILTDSVEVAETISALNSIAGNHGDSTPLKLAYEGKMDYMKSTEKLRNLMENSRYVWYNAAGAEAEIIKTAAETIAEKDLQAACRTGKVGTE